MKTKQNEALRTAIRLLSLRDRTEVELLEKLQRKGFDEKDISKAIEYLKQKGFIDDSKFIQKAEKIAEDRFLGQMGLKNYLIRKGISKDKIENLSQIDELSIAIRLLQRKKHLLKDISQEKKKARIARLLLRRGFSWDTVNQCLDNRFLRDIEYLKNEN